MGLCQILPPLGNKLKRFSFTLDNLCVEKMVHCIWGLREGEGVVVCVFSLPPPPSHSDAVAVPGGAYGPGAGPVFISQLTCSGEEDSVLHCQVLQTIGLAPCDHSRDAGVRCVGKTASGALCF